jgi:hypothetical protein
MQAVRETAIPEVTNSPVNTDKADGQDVSLSEAHTKESTKGKIPEGLPGSHRTWHAWREAVGTWETLSTPEADTKLDADR